MLAYKAPVCQKTSVRSMEYTKRITKSKIVKNIRNAHKNTSMHYKQ